MKFTNIELGVTLEVVKDESGEIWFPGKEVAEALGYRNTVDAILRHVHVEDKKSIRNIVEGIEILDDNNGNSPSEEIPDDDVGNNPNPSHRETRWEETGPGVSRDFSHPEIGSENTNPSRPSKIYINEPGFYSLVSRSQLDGAKVFQRWIHKEVLPSIRKTGGYTLTPRKPSEDLINLTQWIKETFPGTLISVTPHFAVDTREKLEICESIGWSAGQPEITIHCPSGSNTGLVVFCGGNDDENMEKWMEYHEKCSNKVLEISHSGM